MAQNTSNAVMASRVEAHDSLDYFPTPPWATRALCEWIDNRHVIGSVREKLTAWEPACGEHDMVKPLREYFAEVHASDIAPYAGGHEIADFLWPSARRADWIITNPPFRLAEQFVITALARADYGVAMLVRTAFLESATLFNGLFQPYPPSDILQFVERVPMHKGKLDQFGSTATAYCWIVWRKNATTGTQFHWIAPCRKRLERDADYQRRGE